MSKKEKTIADLLLGVQIACALALGGSQFFRALTTVQGTSFSMFATCAVFFGLNFVLSVRAHRVSPSRVTAQVAFMYALWVVMMLADIGALAWNGSYRWSPIDTWSFLLTGVGTAATLVVASRRGLGYNDPFVKGWVAAFFKAVPQFLLAVKVGVEGSAGLAGLAVFAGFLSMAVRGGQLWYSIREYGSDRNRRASAFSEVANLLSWTAVTLVWLIV